MIANDHGSLGKLTKQQNEATRGTSTLAQKITLNMRDMRRNKCPAYSPPHPPCATLVDCNCEAAGWNAQQRADPEAEHQHEQRGGEGRADEPRGEEHLQGSEGRAASSDGAPCCLVTCMLAVCRQS